MSRLNNAAKIAALVLFGILALALVGINLILVLVHVLIWAEILNSPLAGILAVSGGLVFLGFVLALVASSSFRKAIKSFCKIVWSNKSNSVLVVVNLSCLVFIWASEGWIAVCVASLVEASMLIALTLLLDGITNSFGIKCEFDAVAAFIVAQKNRIAMLGGVYAFDAVVNWLFSYPLYISVISKWGMIEGGIYMTIASFTICLVYLVVYDRLKLDLFGLEAAKELVDEWKGYQGDSGIRRFLARQLNKWGWWGAFLALSLWKDPFYTTAFCREGSGQYDGLSLRGWAIFGSSVILGNLPWILFTSGLVWIWNFDLDKAWPVFRGMVLSILDLVSR